MKVLAKPIVPPAHRTPRLCGHGKPTHVAALLAFDAEPRLPLLLVDMNEDMFSQDIANKQTQKRRDSLHWVIPDLTTAIVDDLCLYGCHSFCRRSFLRLRLEGSHLQGFEQPRDSDHRLGLGGRSYLPGSSLRQQHQPKINCCADEHLDYSRPRSPPCTSVTLFWILESQHSIPIIG